MPKRRLTHCQCKRPTPTYTDTNGQFWFNGLRDIPYTLAIDTNDGHYAFSVNLEDATSGFFDLASEARHNFQELEY